MAHYSLPPLDDAELPEKKRRRLAPDPEIPNQAKRDPHEVERLARLAREVKETASRNDKKIDKIDNAAPQWKLDKKSSSTLDEETTGFLTPSPYLQAVLAQREEQLPEIDAESSQTVIPDHSALAPWVLPTSVADHSSEPAYIALPVKIMDSIDQKEPVQWDGNEATMLGKQPSHSEPVASDAWDGNEVTMLGGATGQTNDNGDKEATVIPTDDSTQKTSPSADWLGNELTIQGKASSDWLGNEATMSGAPKAPGDSVTTKSENIQDGGSTDLTLMSLHAGGTSQGAVSTDVTLEMRERGETSPTKEHNKEVTNATWVAGQTAMRSPEKEKGESGGTSIIDPNWHFGGRKGPASGETWGDYEIGGILGEGGMGLVYRAKQISLGRRCAVKVLAPHLAADPGVRNRFSLEALSTSQLNSPHVVAVYAAGEIHDTAYFVMEFVDGMDLNDAIREKRDKQETFTPEESADFIVQAARGLAEAARAGLVHRDIKPGNMLLDSNEQLKITDFGIVKVMGESQLTMTGEAVGTPTYMSPEQGRGDEVDERSDLYSLGVVFYLLLTGRRPFDGATPSALIYQHNYEEPKLPSELMPGIPREYEAICVKLLTKKVEGRYQTAKSLIRDLEDVLEGRKLEMAIAAKLSTGADEARKEHLTWMQRHFLPIAAASIVILLTGAIVGYMWFESQQGRRDRLSTLRESLIVFDNPVAIPANAEQKLIDYIALLHEYGGANFVSDLQTSERWQKKLHTVEDLRNRLIELDKLPLLPYVIAAQAIADLDTLRLQIGSDDPDVLRWGSKLYNTRQQVGLLRRRLRGLDDNNLLTQAQRQSYQESIDRFAPLVPKTDSDVRRWQTRLTDWDIDLARWREAFGQLDKKDIVLLVSEQRRLFGGLTVLTRMLGVDNPDVQRWQLDLRNRQIETDQLLIDIQRFNDRLLLSVDEDHDLSRKLNVLDQDQSLAEQDLDEYRKRLAEDVIRRASVREDLQPLDQQRPLNDFLRSGLKELERVASSQDLDVARWRKKVNAIDSLVDDLQLLNQVVSVPEQSIEQLRSLQKLVGDTDINVTKWTHKIKRIDELVKALLPLNKVVSIPKNADNNVRDLISLVGMKEERIQRWHNKLIQVYSLSKKMRALNAHVVLPPTASQELFDLHALVGNDDALVQRAARRLEELHGPGAPSWASDYGRDRFGPWTQLLISENINMRFRWIPAGFTRIGSPLDEAGRNDDEILWTAYFSDGLWLAETELTQGQWRVLSTDVTNLGAHSSRYRNDNLPADRISYEDIIAVLTVAVTQWPSVQLSLPSEVQWERACRAGSQAAYSDNLGPVENSRLHEIAWYRANSDSRSKVVGLRRSNALGLFDMHGNIWELCSDRYADYPSENIFDHVGRAGELMVARGGSWGDIASSVRAANRLGVKKDLRSEYLGVRLRTQVQWQDGIPDGSKGLNRLRTGELPLAMDITFTPRIKPDFDYSAVGEQESQQIENAQAPATEQEQETERAVTEMEKIREEGSKEEGDEEKDKSKDSPEGDNNREGYSKESLEDMIEAIDIIDHILQPTVIPVESTEHPNKDTEDAP